MPTRLLHLRVGTRLIALACFAGALMLAEGLFGLANMRATTRRMEEGLTQGKRLIDVVDRARKVQSDLLAQTKEWRLFLLRGHHAADRREFLRNYKQQDSLVRAGLLFVRDTLNALGVQGIDV